MPETCFACAYKRLAREAIAALETTARLICLIDAPAGQRFESIRRGMLRRFLDLHTQQIKESALPKGGNGTTIARSGASQGTCVLVEGSFARSAF